MPKFTRLRQLGALGNAAANILTVVTVNWGLVVSLAVAIAAGALNWLRALALNPAVIAGVGAFLAALWTIIGITVLIDRRRPREIKTHADYRYALTFAGFRPRYYGVNEPTPNAGDLSFQFDVINFSPAPIRYEIESLDIRLGTRAVPRLLPGTIYGFMSRGANRSSVIKGFSKLEMSEFYKNNSPDNHAKGTVELSYTYGPPDEPAVRRMKVSLEFYVIMINDGEGIGWQDAIISERDEAINAMS